MLSIWGSTFPKPTLDLDFIGASSLDSRVTFTRGSAATMYDSTGTLVYAPMNLLTYSEQFDNAAWTQFQSSVTANAATAPDATTTADKFIPNATLNGHYLISSATSMTSGTTYVGTVYAKASEQTVLQLTFQGASHGSTYYANFNLSNGTLGNTGGAGVVATITPVSAGWYRCSIAAAATATASAGLVVLSVTSTTDGRLPTYLGDGTSGLYLWGAQLNLSPMAGGITSSLSTYYPTTASAYYGPRFDYNPSTLAARGLLIEEQRTNSIRNNTMQGAAVGTPGTAPTNWAFGTVGTPTVSIIGTGTENGITYIDIRFQAVALDSLTIRFESITQIVAANAQTWATSFYAKLAAGSVANCAVLNRIVFRDSAGTQLTFSDAAFAPTTAGLATQFFSATATASNASTARITNQIVLTASGAVDITLRIGLPQLEQGAFATSVIPTSTVAVTRSADVASMTGTNFSSWYNAVASTVLVTSLISTARTTDCTFVRFDDGSGSNRFQISTGSSFSIFNSFAITAGVSQGNNTVSGPPLNNSAEAFGIETNNSVTAARGSIGVSDTTVNMPSGINRLLIGRDDTSGYVNGYIQRISYYPTRLPNATLQALTA